MTVTTGSIVWLLVGSLILAALAVVVDRINFPQKPFRARRIRTSGAGASRDRTGAHIVDEFDDDQGDGQGDGTPQPRRSTGP